MDFIKRTFSQYSKIFEGFTSSQKATLLLVSAIIVSGFGYLMYNNSNNAYVPLFAEKTLTADELTTAQQGLREQGLTDFKVDAQKIMVPRSKLDQAKAALLVQDSLPSGWAEETLKQANNQNMFTTNSNNQLKADSILGMELRRMLRAVPQIHDASVVWAREKGRSFPKMSKRVTATVALKPEKNHELTSRLANSVKSAVAMAISGLKKSDITVFDQSTGKDWPEDSEDAFDSKILERIKAFEKKHQDKLANLLHYIPDVLVTVNVELDDLKRKVVNSTKVNPKEVVEISNRTNNQKTSDTSQPNQGEVGVLPNTPQNLNAGTGNNRSRTTSQDKSDTVIFPSSTFTVEEFLAAMPKATHVSVVIPEEYFTKVSEIQTSTTQAAGTPPPKTRAQILTDIQAQVANAVGQSATANTISVTSYIPVDPEIIELEESIMDSVSSSLSQWGGAIGMSVFAIWALLMLKKSFNRLPDLPEEPKPASVIVPQPGPEEEQEELIEKRETERDKLQTVVRDNPELTAAVINNWLQSAR